jgi:hypothetical protein
MLYRRSVAEAQDRASVHPWRVLDFSLSFRARVFHSNTRMYVRLLGPCFKTGRLKPLSQHPKCVMWGWKPPNTRSHWVPQSQPLYSTRDYNTSEDATFPEPFSNGQNWCWPVQQKVHQTKVRLISAEQDWLQAFPFQQFHILFNSLFKVLFIFPSRYLFAIGFSPIFSFRWNLPPIWSCIPKQLDSSRVYHNSRHRSQRRDCHPLRCSFPRDLMRRCPHGKHFSNLQLGQQSHQILNLSFSLFTRSYWGNPC